ncbi:hypothetical protein KEM56_006994 [Ascosphaera pollenicola]|nr:hypothetical protein KEM56_006994 [Ascosphaera pollenicola]
MTAGNSGGYSGRRAPNFSQYLNELNMIPSPYDQALQQQEQSEVYDMESDLAMFANTEFLDFDTGLSLSEVMEPTALPTTKQGQQSQQQQQQQQDPSVNLSRALSRRSSSLGEPLNPRNEDSLNYYDMLNGADFNISTFAPFNPDFPPVSGVLDYPATQPQVVSSNDKMKQHPQQLMLPHELQHQSPAAEISIPHGSAFDPLSASDASPTTTSAPTAQKLLPSGGATNATSHPSPAGMRRKSSTQTVGDFSRVAQEEDRRRRNTAASARFRVKKKEREKNMERMVKDMTMKNTTLETRVSQLEMENKWLKSLITEKNSWADSDLNSLYQKFKETTAQESSLVQKTQAKSQAIRPAPIQPNIQP